MKHVSRHLMLLVLLLNSACAVTVAKKDATPTLGAPAAPVMRGNSARPAGRVFQLSSSDVLSATWDYLPSEEANVDRFEIQVDTTRLNLAKPAPVTTTATLLTYKASIGTFPVGTHTATLYACNVTACTPSTAATFTVDPSAPAPPSNLRITGTSISTVALAWDDGSANEDGFKIEQNGAEVVTVGPNITTAAVMGLVPATSYSFRARAFNTVGYSAYSNTVDGMTQSPPLPEDTTTPTTAISFFRRNGNSRNYSTTAQASDAVGVVRIMFLVDNRTVAVLYTPSTGTALSGSYSLNFSESNPGSHTLVVQAYDAAGNMGTASRTFTR